MQMQFAMIQECQANADEGAAQLEAVREGRWAWGCKLQVCQHGQHAQHGKRAGADTACLLSQPITTSSIWLVSQLPTFVPKRLASAPAAEERSPSQCAPLGSSCCSRRAT